MMEQTFFGLFDTSSNLYCNTVKTKRASKDATVNRALATGLERSSSIRICAEFHKTMVDYDTVCTVV